MVALRIRDIALGQEATIYLRIVLFQRAYHLSYLPSPQIVYMSLIGSGGKPPVGLTISEDIWIDTEEKRIRYFVQDMVGKDAAA
jgi:hypothetical protein